MRGGRGRHTHTASVPVPSQACLSASSLGLFSPSLSLTSFVHPFPIAILHIHITSSILHYPYTHTRTPTYLIWQPNYFASFTLIFYHQLERPIGLKLRDERSESMCVCRVLWQRTAETTLCLTHFASILDSQEIVSEGIPISSRGSDNSLSANRLATVPHSPLDTPPSYFPLFSLLTSISLSPLSSFLDLFPSPLSRDYPVSLIHFPSSLPSIFRSMFTPSFPNQYLFLFSDRVGLPQPLTQCLVPAPPPWHSICALHLHLSSSPSTGILQSNRRALVPPSATLRVFFTYLHYFIPQSFTINRTRYNIADVYKSYPRHSFWEMIVGCNL